MEPSEALDAPLPSDDRFAVELARFLEGRVDPSLNVAPPGNPPVDPFACRLAQAQLDRIVQ